MQLLYQNQKPHTLSGVKAAKSGLTIHSFQRISNAGNSFDIGSAPDTVVRVGLSALSRMHGMSAAIPHSYVKKPSGICLQDQEPLFRLSKCDLPSRWWKQLTWYREIFCGRLFLSINFYFQIFLYFCINMGNKICSVNTGKKQNAATYRRRSRAINIVLSLLRELPGGHGAQHGA